MLELLDCLCRYKLGSVGRVENIEPCTRLSICVDHVVWTDAVFATTGVGVSDFAGWSEGTVASRELLTECPCSFLRCGEMLLCADHIRASVQCPPWVVRVLPKQV